MEEHRVTTRPKRPPTHPGAILREDVLPALDIKVMTAARELGIARQTLHRILAEKAPVTPAMALRLGKFCGNGPRIWLATQQEYDQIGRASCRERVCQYV